MRWISWPEYGLCPSCVRDAVVKGGADGAFFVSEMRLCDRCEAIEFASQCRKALRWSGLAQKGQGLDLMQDRGYRGVVTGEVPDCRGKVWPGIEQLCEHAVVFAPVMGGQGGAERQAVLLQPGLHVLIAVQCFPDPGEFISQVLVGSPELLAECRSPLGVVCSHAAVIPFVSAPSCLTPLPPAHRAGLHSTTAQRDPESRPRCPEP
jgi:hypothetical protein